MSNGRAITLAAAIVVGLISFMVFIDSSTAVNECRNAFVSASGSACTRDNAIHLLSILFGGISALVIVAIAYKETR